MLEKEIDILESVALAQMACNFLQLVANSAEEIVNRENSLVMIYEESGPPDNTKYKEHIKWADKNIAEPVLFNFYHGIELSLKSLLVSKSVSIGTNHKLSILLKDVKKNFSDKRLTDFYSKYISTDNLDPILSNFCNKSEITMDYYYQSLKYPTSIKGKPFSRNILHYNGNEGVRLFRSIKNDIEKFIDIFQEAVSNELRA